MRRLLSTLALVLLAAAALGEPLAAQQTDPAPPPARIRKDRHLITQEEVAQSAATNLHDLIRAARPMWLRMRAGARLQVTGTPAPGGALNELAPQEIFVYVDGVKFGNQESLRSLSTHDVGSLQFFDASSATQRWGTGHPNGAILINRKMGQ